MNIDLIKKIILDSDKKIEDITFFQRDLNVPEDVQSIISIIGPRRSGKTFFLYILTKKLRNEGKGVLFISFDDERIVLRNDELNMIIDAGYDIYKEFEYIFIDEVQEIIGWEKFVKRIGEEKKVYLTGSSSKLMSKEIATHLRGRTLTYELFPISFREIVKLSGIEIHNTYSTKDESLIRELFEQYITYGGFPEVFLANNHEIRLKLIEAYKDVMLLRDIIERYRVKNYRLLRIFLNILSNSYSKESSVRKASSFLNTRGYKHDRNLLYEYAEYLSDTFMIFYLPKFSKSIYKRESYLKKIYVIDGFSIYAQERSLSKDLENLIFLELRKKGFKEGETLFYYKSDYIECDFLLTGRDGVFAAMQVSHFLNEENKSRELRGLTKAMEEFNLNEGLIITKNQSDRFTYTYKSRKYQISVIPAWKWALQGSQ